MQQLKNKNRENNKLINPLQYYEEFRRKPKTFRELYASSSEHLSSSDDESSSEDDFPSPNTPHNQKQKTTDLFNKLYKLERKLQLMEIENKKLRSIINLKK